MSANPKEHIVLLGDSIFDNGIYVPDGPSVIDHLRNSLPAKWKATLVAHDGDVVAHLESQLSSVPPDATHLVISVGDNDALGAAGRLTGPAGNIQEALWILSDLRRNFHRAYKAMLWQALSLHLPIAVCTIYDSVPGLSAHLKTALTVFNDAIVREALAAQLQIIDLRNICADEADYSPISPIEPSEQGGRKIAQAILSWAESSS